MKGITVYLRDEAEALGQPLCEVAFDQLDALIAEMRRWTVALSEGDPSSDLSGQFVLDDSARFEIIVGGEDA